MADLPFNDELKERLRQAMESQRLQAWFDKIRKQHAVVLDEKALDSLVIPGPPPASSTAPVSQS